MSGPTEILLIIGVFCNHQNKEIIMLSNLLSLLKVETVIGQGTVL